MNTTGCIDYLNYTERTKGIQQIDDVLAEISHYEKSFIAEKEKTLDEKRIRFHDRKVFWNLAVMKMM